MLSGQFRAYFCHPEPSIQILLLPSIVVKSDHTPAILSLPRRAKPNTIYLYSCFEVHKLLPLFRSYSCYPDLTPALLRLSCRSYSCHTRPSIWTPAIQILYAILSFHATSYSCHPEPSIWPQPRHEHTSMHTQGFRRSCYPDGNCCCLSSFTQILLLPS